MPTADERPLIARDLVANTATSVAVDGPTIVTAIDVSAEQPPLREVAAQLLPDTPTRPAAERRFVIWFWVLTLGIALISGVQALGQGGLPPLGLLATLAIAMVAMYKFMRARIGRKFLAGQRAFICPRCHYPLGTLAEGGSCPECGTVYTRAKVVALWESHFGLRPRYSRTAPLEASAMPTITAVQSANPDRPPPWKGNGLRNAMQSVEAAARKNGCRSMRFAAYALAIDGGAAHLGRPLPRDLLAFYAWLDPHQWSWLVNPRRLRVRDVGVPGTALPTGETESRADQMARAFIAQMADESMADVVRFRTPPMLRTHTSVIRTRAGGGEGAAGTDLSVMEREITRLGSPGTPLGRPLGWSEAAPLEIADTLKGETVVYWLGSAAWAPGTILAVSTDGAATWLGDSLADWLARLALCDGMEPALQPGLSVAAAAAGLPDAVREEYLKEYAARNRGAEVEHVEHGDNR